MSCMHHLKTSSNYVISNTMKSVSALSPFESRKILPFPVKFQRLIFRNCQRWPYKSLDLLSFITDSVVMAFAEV